MRPSNCGIPGDRQQPSPGPPAGKSPDEVHLDRIEEWVISTLDGRHEPSPRADWLETLDDFTLARRTDEARAARPESPATPAGWARFRLSRRGEVVVVSLTDQAIVRDDDLAELTGDLQAIFEAGYPRVVLDFFLVERLSSRAAAAIGDAVRSGFLPDGRVVKFSGIRPELAAVFAMTGLDPRVMSYPDAASAVRGLWPDPPEFRPLPVPILAALLRAEDARPGPNPRDRPPGRPETTNRDHEGGAAMYSTTLIIREGAGAGRSFAIKGARYLIGRGPDCQLRLGSAAVSRSHAVIESRGGRPILRDLASMNGTYLNGRPIRDAGAEICDGDHIRIGQVEFVLALTAADHPAVRPEPAGRDIPPPRAEGDPTSRADPAAAGETLDQEESGEEGGLKYEIIEDTLVVTPLAPDLSDEASVDGLRDSLLMLSERRLPKRVVVSLSRVGSLSSRAIGILLSHHLRLDRSGGGLRLCLANPRVAVVLDQVKIGMLIECHATVDDAVIAAWPVPAT